MFGGEHDPPGIPVFDTERIRHSGDRPLSVRPECSVALQHGDGVDDDPMHLMLGRGQPRQNGEPVGLARLWPGSGMQGDEALVEKPHLCLHLFRRHASTVLELMFEYKPILPVQAMQDHDSPGPQPGNNGLR